ncbi:MAG: maf protein [Chloroflexi bacterium]|nr:maf protein [Chloroflexota bacterium]
MLAARLALAKACAGAGAAPGAVVLAADTVVALGSESLGKPLDAVEATQMLQRLRGREHVVITAVATARAEPLGGQMRTAGRVSRTRVWMRAYSDAEIEDYVGTHDPFDKAGAYAIQHSTFRPVERIEGCYLTVVGLPLPEVCELLAGAGLSIPRMTSSRLDALCPGCIDAMSLRS